MRAGKPHLPMWKSKQPHLLSAPVAKYYSILDASQAQATGRSTDMNLYHLLRTENGVGSIHTTGGMHTCGDQSAGR